jgi:hypothetical protein
MKVKSLYWIAAAVVVLALVLFLTPKSEFVASNSEDVSRFTDSLDVEVAMGNLHSDPPTMMVGKESLKPTLLFPPSQDDLAKLSGPAVGM